MQGNGNGLQQWESWARFQDGSFFLLLILEFTLLFSVTTSANNDATAVFKLIDDAGL